MNVPVLEKCAFSPRPDLSHSLHCLDGCLDEFSVVSDGDISALLELDCRILLHALESISIDKRKGFIRWSSPCQPLS